MGFFDNAKKAAQDILNKSDYYRQFNNKEFSEGVIAGMAMVAAAGPNGTVGDVSPEEKAKVGKAIQKTEALKHFDSGELVNLFNKYVDLLEFTPGEVHKEWMQIPSHQRQAALDICFAIALSDGNISTDEQKMLRKLASDFGIDISERFAA